MISASSSDQQADMDLPFMDAFPKAEMAQWRAAVEKVLKGGDFEKRLVARTADGICIEPLYAASSPVSRPTRAKAGRWRVSARMDHPEPAQAAALGMADLEGGADSLVLSFAGSRAARGYGLIVGDVDALDEAFDGVEMELIALRLDPARQGQANVLLMATLAEKRGLAPETLSIDFGLDPIGVLASEGALATAWPEVASNLADTIASLKARGFTGPFVTADARPYHEAGATEAQELGAALATAVTYLRLLEAQGMPLNDARDAISFVLVADTDQFLTIAKFRAARLLWERVQAACGLDPKPMVLHTETAWRSLTRRDPWVNLLRATIATFAAGVGGADSLTVLPFTAALGLPDAFARRVARNTQLVLLEEANLARVADPAAGAGGFEALTLALCEQAWTKFQDLEREATDGRPGIVAALANGHVQAGLARQRELRAKAIATRREPITGTSEFANLAELPVAVLDIASVDPEAPEPQLRAMPLPSCRIAEPFEVLRDRAEAFAETAGGAPAVFLATLGALADFAARAGFVRNLFGAGGLAAAGGDDCSKDGVTDVAALVEAFRISGCRFACLCGSDTAYAAETVEVAHALVSAGATVWLAGKPGESEAAWREAGITGFVFAGCDAIDLLVQAQAVVLADLQRL